MTMFRMGAGIACLAPVVIVAFFVVCTTPPAGLSAVYYVATNGSDIAAGTLAAPWRTPQKAAVTLVAGDTVYVRQGVYTGEVIAANSGSSSLWITYAAYSNETRNTCGGRLVVRD